MQKKYDSVVAKLFLLILNVFTALIGAGILAVSIYALIAPADAVLSKATIPESYSIGGIVIGGFMLLTAFVGCFGSRSRGVLLLYVFLLLILIAGQVALGVLIARGNINIRDAASEFWGNWSTEQRANFQNARDCCGFESVIDRQAVTEQCPAIGITTRPACFPLLEQQYQDSRKTIYIVLFALGGFEVLALFGCLLMLCGCCGQTTYRKELEAAHSLNRNYQ
ncbi:hypothetical protein MIR68_005276 [Amoeboaphelidium protococcarum]|nr:hypothetical protein MIR68_005276 [Amoeboaphelidium protococcarum]